MRWLVEVAAVGVGWFARRLSLARVGWLRSRRLALVGWFARRLVGLVGASLVLVGLLLTLPDPVRPTMPTFSPARTVRLTPSSARGSSARYRMLAASNTTYHFVRRRGFGSGSGSGFGFGSGSGHTEERVAARRDPPNKLLDARVARGDTTPHRTHPTTAHRTSPREGHAAGGASRVACAASSGGDAAAVASQW